MFTTPKPFRGQFDTIQRNALRSWSLMQPPCDIIVFGDEEGTAAVSAELRLTHVPDVGRNELGMPLVRSLFRQAQHATTRPFLCYANADIIFLDDLTNALRRFDSQQDRFLMIGQRYDVDLNMPLDFASGWEGRLRSYVIQNGLPVTGIDYFVFPRDLWTEIPDTLVVGRAGWDSWPIYEARLQKAIVIDATQVVMAVHQNHDYSHHPDGRGGVYAGLEVERNYATLGGRRNLLTALDATHLLTEDGLRVRCRSCYPMCVCKPASF